MAAYKGGSVLLLSLILLVGVRGSSLPADDPLSPALHYYERLHKDNVEHKTVRDNMPRLQDQLKELHFTVHSRHFRLILSPTVESFHPSLQSRSSHPINYAEFMRGHVFGEEFSHVTAHVTREGIITASITLETETYYIEPSSRHIKKSHDYHMIVYKASDMKHNLTGDSHSSFCGHDDSKKTNHTHYLNLGRAWPEGRGRLRRQASSPVTVCPMSLIGTTSFYNQFGMSRSGMRETEKAINYLLLLMLQVDMIYRTTNFYIPNVGDSAAPGTKGLQIAEVRIYDTTDGAPSYNQDSNVMSEDLLREFSRTDWSRFCLAHLFIANNFADNSRLGVAYIADASSFYLGGVCSRRTNINAVPFSGNTGISSFRSKSRLLLLGEAVIVTAHEIGHNWGSQHDSSSSAECSPSPDNGGKYLMYPIAQDGLAPNNDNFSPCSVRGISRVLSTHESDCFTGPTNNLCGNFIIDGGEQCDPGPAGTHSDTDRCCNRDCTYRGSAVCSDTNHDCCEGCVVRSAGSTCLPRKTGNVLCLANRTCDGVNNLCPSDERYAPVDTPCGFGGFCVSTDNTGRTECNEFCEQMNLTTCHCTGDDQCMICCNDGTGCSRINPTINLPDGSFCEGGSCQQGECILSDPDLVSFLFDLFGNFSTNAFLQFLYENIVATVIVLSLLVWIPVSAAVHIFDLWWEKRRNKKKLYTESDKSKLLGSKEDVDYEPDSDPEEVEEVPGYSRKFHDRDPEHVPITHHVIEKESMI